MIIKLDVSQHSQDIHTVMQAAYKVEAELLNISDFYPLNRSIDDIAESENSFLGIMEEDKLLGLKLLGVCELEAVDSYTIMISALVVLPSVFRLGIASKLLVYVMKKESTKTILVSTAKDNIPAVSLYQKFGFEIYTELVLADGLVIVELEKTTE